MLVPRVYGIGDLSHIITGHGYKQAEAILDSMGSDLSCFVPTDAYRSSVKALQEHGGPRFSWGGASLVAADEMRRAYIAAVRAGDQHELAPLLEFARS